MPCNRQTLAMVNWSSFTEVQANAQVSTGPALAYGWLLMVPAIICAPKTWLLEYTSRKRSLSVRERQ